MEDMKADADERADFFAEKAQEGNEELMGELDELEAEMIGGQMGGVAAG